MITNHQKIRIDEKVVFETITCDSETTLNFNLEGEAYFTYVKNGSHTAISPNELIDVEEGNLSISIGKSLILKTSPNKVNDIYEVLIIRISKDIVKDILLSQTTKVNLNEHKESSKDMFTGKACVVSQNYVEGIILYFTNQHVITEQILNHKMKEIILFQSKKAREIALLFEQFINRKTSSFKETIEAHVLSEISIDDLAQLCNMSLSTFKRQFKQTI